VRLFSVPVAGPPPTVVAVRTAPRQCRGSRRRNDHGQARVLRFWPARSLESSHPCIFTPLRTASSLSTECTERDGTAAALQGARPSSRHTPIGIENGRLPSSCWPGQCRRRRHRREYCLWVRRPSNSRSLPTTREALDLPMGVAHPTPSTTFRAARPCVSRPCDRSIQFKTGERPEAPSWQQALDHLGGLESLRARHSECCPCRRETRRP